MEESTDNRWFRYRMSETAAGRQPMSWGQWCSNGMPAPDEDEE